MSLVGYGDIYITAGYPPSLGECNDPVGKRQFLVGSRLRRLPADWRKPYKMGCVTVLDF